MTNKRPFVSAAFICENILRDVDGVTSAIRIVDRFTIPPDPLPEGMKPMVNLTAFVALKSGDVQGKSTVTLKLRYPSGKAHVGGLSEVPILLNGGEHGATITVNVKLGVREFGLHWIDVYWNSERLTSIPIMLVQGAAETPHRSD